MKKVLTITCAISGFALLILQCLSSDLIRGGRAYGESHVREPRKTHRPPRSRRLAMTLDDLHYGYGSAPSLFNAVHSAMRQWGSSLYHNGISLFPATVPQGTLFFHGRHDAAWPSSPQWLGFEMEQANFFARSRRARAPPRRDASDIHETQPRIPHASLRRTIDTDAETERHSNAEPGGYVHTFRTTRALRLIYLDGMSAGKSDLGTMDLTDFLIDWSSNTRASDTERAIALCRWIEVRGYHLDGIIRMEQNHEIIFCDFTSDTLELMHTVQTAAGQASNVAGNRWTFWEWARAAERRYHDIGASRVELDHTSMVTFYGSEAAMSFDYAEGLPRLTNLSESAESSFIQAVDDIFLDRDWSTTERARNWQDISDLIVDLYARKLQILQRYADGNQSDRFDAVLDNMVAPFMDHRVSDMRARRREAIESCTYAYLPVSLTTVHEDKLFVAFEEVMATLCVSLMALTDPDVLLQVKSEVVHQLMRYLRWTTWKECVGCQIDELCTLPMWPHGGLRDRVEPNCVTVETFRNEEHTGYWAAGVDAINHPISSAGPGRR